MRVCENGIYRDMTPEEEAEAARIAQEEAQKEQYVSDEEALLILLGVTE